MLPAAPPLPEPAITPSLPPPGGEPFWVWAATIGGLIVIFAVDLWAGRRAREVTMAAAARGVAIYVGLAVFFAAGLVVFGGQHAATSFIAGYVTEYSLSVDNLFVFLLIMTTFAVPKAYQHRVLLVGILIALVMRGGFIVAGAAVLSRFSWVFYLFGAFLVITAYRVCRGEDDDAEYRENLLVRSVRRVLPVTDSYREGRLTVVEHGKRWVTPMLMVMIAIGLTDLLFALDSIPAIFGLTKDAYIVFTANAFALLGLRQLYFLLDGLLARLVYLKWGLGLILLFIGIKLVLEALHTNTLPFVNGGRPVPVPLIGIEVSLGVIVGVLAVTTVASLLRTRLRERAAV
ncbi:TerC family protein [Actinomycetospora endophytica]|uniref:TerC family protein n=1 Tax=Actinomycetospora endophytica TaxID=2291215 RepID=A0ABS8PHU0_9PSEU|nr:TerC family protein [Actinomycetospora endophytica]MCD2197734.1 TerC family protein [Actinomycetospora endophytica]